MTLSIVSLSAGLGLAATSLVLLIVNKVNSRFNFEDVMLLRSKLIRKSPVLLKKGEEMPLTKKDLIISGMFALVALGLAPNFQSGPGIFGIAFIISLLGVRFFRKIRLEVIRGEKVKELSILFEAIELYTKAGYSLMQALRAAKILTPKLAPAVDKCLDYWPSSPRRALEQLKKELNIQEGEMLVSLLIYMETAGTKDLKGILGREAVNIERLRKMKVESKIASRPLILMIYRVLPLAATLGIIVGSLLFRTYNVMSEAGIYIF